MLLENYGNVAEVTPRGGLGKLGVRKSCQPCACWFGAASAGGGRKAALSALWSKKNIFLAAAQLHASYSYVN